MSAESFYPTVSLQLTDASRSRSHQAQPTHPINPGHDRSTDWKHCAWKEGKCEQGGCQLPAKPWRGKALGGARIGLSGRDHARSVHFATKRALCAQPAPQRPATHHGVTTFGLTSEPQHRDLEVN